MMTRKSEREFVILPVIQSRGIIDDILIKGREITYFFKDKLQWGFSTGLSINCLSLFLKMILALIYLLGTIIAVAQSVSTASSSIAAIATYTVAVREVNISL